MGGSQNLKRERDEGIPVTFIDVHVHVVRTPGYAPNFGPSFATPEQLLAMYDARGIERGVIQPIGNPEARWMMQSQEVIMGICAEWSDRFVPFVNLDPRFAENSPHAPLLTALLYWQDRGCKGVGEVMANLPFDDPRVLNLFRACEVAGLPVLFHVAPARGGKYGLYDEPGLPRLEKALQAFPDLVFLGHSQAFWVEVAPLPADLPDATALARFRGSYPGGPVPDPEITPGRVVELMRAYPNLHGDLSAGSGFNAVSRDEPFGAWFLEKFADRLYFGTDITSPRSTTPLVDYLHRLRAEGHLSASAFAKIARENATRLLGLE